MMVVEINLLYICSIGNCSSWSIIGNCSSWSILALVTVALVTAALVTVAADQAWPWWGLEHSCQVIGHKIIVLQHISLSVHAQLRDKILLLSYDDQNHELRMVQGNIIIIGRQSFIFGRCSAYAFEAWPMHFEICKFVREAFVSSIPIIWRNAT